MNFINVHDSWLVSCRISFEIIETTIHPLYNYKYFSGKICVLYLEYVFTIKSSCIWISDIWDSTSFRHLEILCIHENQRESRLISRFSSYVWINHGKIIIVHFSHIWMLTVSFHIIRPHVCQLLRRLESFFRVRTRYSTIPFRSAQYEVIPICILSPRSSVDTQSARIESDMWRCILIVRCRSYSRHRRSFFYIPVVEIGLLFFLTLDRKHGESGIWCVTLTKDTSTSYLLEWSVLRDTDTKTYFQISYSKNPERFPLSRSVTWIINTQLSCSIFDRRFQFLYK